MFPILRTNSWMLWACFLIVFLLVGLFMLMRSPWRLRWKLTLGLSTSFMILASCAIHTPPAPVKNVPAPISTLLSLAFLHDVYPTPALGAPSTTLVALNASTGALRWQKSFGDHPAWLAAAAQT